MRTFHAYGVRAATLLALWGLFVIGSQTARAQARDAWQTRARQQVRVARARLARAAQAFGGVEALKELHSFSYTGQGQRLSITQKVDPGGAARGVSAYEQLVSVDLATGSLRQDITREISYPFAAVTDYTNLLKGQLGYVEGTNNILGAPEGPMDSARWAAIHKEHLLLNPYLIVRHALLHPEALLPRRSGFAVDVSALGAGERPVRMFLERRSGRVVRAHVVENDHLLRDVPVDVYYASYQPVDGFTLPTAVSLEVDAELVAHEERSEVAVNPVLDGDLFAFPDGPSPSYDPVAAERASDSHQWHQGFIVVGIPADQLQLDVVATELSEGVFHLTGGLHHSLVVEQQAGIVVAEAPLYPERADALIAWIRGRFPTKPITHVIASHHHADHSGGLRSFVAEGATVVASRRARSLYRRVFRAESSVSPDRLASEPTRARIRSVAPAGVVGLDDPLRPVHVHHIESGHATDMVVVSLPQQGMVFQADIYSPGFPLNLELAIELRDQIVSLGLDATRMPAGHGAVGSFAELEAAIDAAIAADTQ